ncbi:MAG: YncE family protein [Nitrospirae bacterium]|nr:MAG: YncE family protein [Nitrospirota bacterium]
MRRLLSTLVILSLLLLCGCALPERKTAQRSAAASGELTVYLDIPDSLSRDISFVIKGIAIRTKDGREVEVITGELPLRSTSERGRQVRLGEGAVPPGEYVGLVIRYGGSRLHDLPRERDIPPGDPVWIEQRLDIYKNQNTTLFIRWLPDRSTVDERFVPAFEVQQRPPTLSRALLFVTNSGSGNLTVIDTNTMKVVETIKLGGSPTGLTLGVGENALRLYVVNTTLDSLSVINTSTLTVERTVPLRLGKAPLDVHAMVAGPDGELLFIANLNSNSLSVMETTNLREIGRISVGAGPSSITSDPLITDMVSSVYIPPEDFDLIERYQQRYLNLYVANRYSNTVSLIRINRFTGEPRYVLELDAGWEPVRLSPDPARARVYISAHGSERIGEIPVAELIRTGGRDVVNWISLGTGTVDVAPDSSFERLYVLRDEPPEVVVLRPDRVDEGAASDRLLPVMGRLPLPGTPADMVPDEEKNLLYVIDSSGDQVLVVDRITLNIMNRISVGRRPVRGILIPAVR